MLNKVVTHLNNDLPDTNQIFQIKNNYKPLLVISFLLFSDIFAVSLSLFISYFIRKSLIPFFGGQLNISMILPLYLLLIFIIPGIFSFMNLYPGHGRVGVVEFRTVVLSLSLSSTLVGLLIYALGLSTNFSRFVFFLTWLFSIIVVISFRLVVHNRGSLQSWWGQPAVVIGDYQDVTKIITYLQSARRIGYKPIAAILLTKNSNHQTICGIPVFEFSSTIIQQFHKDKISLAIYTNRVSNFESSIRRHIHTLNKVFPKIIFVLADANFNILSMTAIDLAGHPSLLVQYNLLNLVMQRFKRIIDLTLCLISLLITLPLFITISTIVRIDSPGPIFYVQKRLGKNGKLFNMFKFRTMKVGSEDNLINILNKDEFMLLEYQKYHKLHNDPRLTQVGKFLRKISFDEFPQIWNVIRGEMSWVGPRAYLPSELKKMGDAAETILRVAPGLTGWWQVMGRHELSFEERLQLDEYYIGNYSLIMDTYILLKTIFVVISGHGV